MEVAKKRQYKRRALSLQGSRQDRHCKRRSKRFTGVFFMGVTMNCFGLFVFIMAFGSVSMTLVKPYPSSCVAIKKQAPKALSGLYDIIFGNDIITVYCEMALHGGGFTFIPRDAVRKGTLAGFVEKLFTQQSEVLLRFQRKNGLQPYTLIKQLFRYKKTKLGIRMHNYAGYTKPLNSYMQDYLLLGILPKNKANKRHAVQGFLSNGVQVKFQNCDGNPNSYFAFFPNHREQGISPYHKNNLGYERRGVAVNWRNTGIPSYGHRQLPNDFLFLTELHFGGCGCYTSSDRWVNDFGTAIGVR